MVPGKNIHKKGSLSRVALVDNMPIGSIVFSPDNMVGLTLPIDQLAHQNGICTAHTVVRGPSHVFLTIIQTQISAGIQGMLGPSIYRHGA